MDAEERECEFFTRVVVSGADSLRSVCHRTGWGEEDKGVVRYADGETEIVFGAVIVDDCAMSAANTLYAIYCIRLLHQ